MRFFRELMMVKARADGYPAGCIHRSKNYGRTNEDADRNIIKDLSGTGTDIQLYNFGWIEESGYNTTTYKGALVSDGVDDYGLCKNFPILTKEKGYTICVVRKPLNYYISSNSSLLSNKGAFVVDNYNNNIYNIYSWGEKVDVNINREPFIYQTSNSYNGLGIKAGTESNGTDALNLFENSYGCALYSLEIYDRDLSIEEIAAVKARMVAEYEKETGETYYNNVDGFVTAWDEGLNPNSIEAYGNREFVNKWDFYLLDTTDNAGEVTVPVGKLKRNNLLRFEDGSFAPTVGITEAQRAECDVALYLDQAAQQKYCDAGTFNAETFYNNHGMAKLYNAEGIEVRVLRPWETTETKYTIGIGRMDTVYLLDNVKGESGKTWKGLFSRGMMWDGIDVSLYPLPPTVFGPGPSCTMNKKTRNFFFVYPGETNCQSAKGQNNLCTMFYDQQLTYPRVNDMHQVNNMTYARANNADPEASFPYAEGGYLTLNTYITSLEVYYGTKNLHAAKMFGSGISSNDTCNTEETWLENGGVRFKKSEEEIWTYARFNEQKDIYYNATGSRTNFSTFLNLEHPKEACMESQMAASFAVETGVIENTDFEFYGSTYRYVVVPGTDGLASLNVRLYKVLAQTVSAYTAEGSAQSWNIEVNLRMSLYGGVNLSGDIFIYCGGGYETVGTCLFPESGSTGNPVEMYLQPDQRKWHSEKTASIDNLGKFGFESEYKKIGEATNLGNSYSALRQPFAPWSIVKGGNISTGECFYSYASNYWSSKLNQRVRLGSRFRGSAIHGLCSSRSLHAHYYVLYASRISGGSAQALVGAAPLQAE